MIPNRFSSTISRGDARAALNLMRDALAGALLELGPVQVSIADDTIAPWQGWGDGPPPAGVWLRLAPQSGAADDLVRITATGLVDTSSSVDSRLILIQAAQPTHEITIRHAQGGAGQILTPDGQPWPITGSQMAVLAWDPTASPRSWRLLGFLFGPEGLPRPLSLRLQSWTSAARPSAVDGRVGYSSDRQRIEWAIGGAWRTVLDAAPSVDVQWTLQSGAAAYGPHTAALAIAPAIVQWELRCTATDGQYQAGEHVPLEFARTSEGDIACYASARWASGQITLRAAQRVTPRLVLPDGSGQYTLDPGKWAIRVRVWT